MLKEIVEIQTTKHIMMVRPKHFGFNPQTASSNAFQTDDGSLSKTEIQARALKEFDQFVEKLQKNGIHVFIVEDSDTPQLPDAIFPNNWVSFHRDGTVITYPMFAPVRRLERRPEIFNQLGTQFEIHDRFNLETYEDQGQILEGTGSLVLDRSNKIAYACRSNRTDPKLLETFSQAFGYEGILFHAADQHGQEIYHTNVMMALGKHFVIICLDAIKDPQEKDILKGKFRSSNKEIVEISFKQMNAFAGNMLEVENEQGDALLILSEQAFLSLNQGQIEQLEQYVQLLYSPIPTIEAYGGGSVRCMMAEIFLPQKQIT